MPDEELESILSAVRAGELTVETAADRIRGRLRDDLGFAVVDLQRTDRLGYPEVVYCAGKTADQVRSIMVAMHQRGSAVLGTRATEAMHATVARDIVEAEWHPAARAITIPGKVEPPTAQGTIAIVAAGTSDLPVVEEARVTAELFGNRVSLVVDVGVAGIHRLIAKLEQIRRAKVVVVVAGMEGALASVVGGLVGKPIIAVPTSVGYGASFGGLAALLAMLNSCAPGVAVVNIDNGFGAGYLAGLINHG